LLSFKALSLIQKMIRAEFPAICFFEDMLAFDPESDVQQPATAKIRERIGLAPNWPI